MVTVALMGSNHDYLNWYGRHCWKTTFHLVEKTVRSAAVTLNFCSFPAARRRSRPSWQCFRSKTSSCNPVITSQGKPGWPSENSKSRRETSSRCSTFTGSNLFFFISRFYPLSSTWSFNRTWTRWLASPLALWQHSGLVFWSLVNGCLSNTSKI